jgi:hypothetical protein
MSTMDDRELSCLIQAPDNLGDNLVHVAAWVTAEARQRDEPPDAVLQELINEVGYNGRDLPPTSARVRMKRRHREFLLQVRLPYKDSAERVVPILCYGLLPDREERSFPVRVAESLTAFLVTSEMPPDEQFAVVVEDAARRLARDAHSKNPLLAPLRAIADTFVGSVPEPAPDTPVTPAEPEPELETVPERAPDPPASLTEPELETVPERAPDPPATLTEAELETVLRAIDLAESHAEATPEMLELRARLRTPSKVETS